MKHNCSDKLLRCQKCDRSVSSVYYYLNHKCSRVFKKKQKERAVICSSSSNRRSSISRLSVSPINSFSSTIPSVELGSSNTSDSSEVFFLRQRVKSLELIISQLSLSILELSNKIPNQVSQVSIPAYSMDSLMDSFNINTVSDGPCSSAIQNTAL